MTDSQTSLSAFVQNSAQHAVQRDAWKSIRSHIHQYEQKLLELQFDHQQKVNVVEALKLEIRLLAQKSRECEEKEFKCTQEASEALKAAMAVDRQLMAAEQDHRMLTQQLVAEQQGLAEDVQKLKETRTIFEQHLQSQQEYLEKLKIQLSTAREQDDPAAALTS